MLTTQGETYILELYDLKENSAYEYENKPSIKFKGRPANAKEKRSYRVLKGVNSSNDSVFIYCSNLPKDVKDGDRVKFMGEIWTISSVGYYFVESRIVNASIMSEEYLIARCPKGITLS